MLPNSLAKVVFAILRLLNTDNIEPTYHMRLNPLYGLGPRDSRQNWMKIQVGYNFVSMIQDRRQPQSPTVPDITSGAAA